MSLADLRARLKQAWLRCQLPPAQSQLLKPIDPYEDWLAHNVLTNVRIDDLNQALSTAETDLPRMSVIMPVFRPNRAFFIAAVRSLQAQILDQWELCLCDDGSNDPALTELLAELSGSDNRIVTTSLQSNSGISAATNAAAQLATGDVLLFLDQDDLLSPDALAEFALAFAEDPQIDLAYSDNDKIDLHGRRYAPAFKPDWSPTFLLSHMYLGHAIAVRRSLFAKVGGLRSQFDGSQDYDLALRVSEHAQRIKHISRILYHWRAMPGSTAVSAKEKPSSIAAGQACLAEALERRGINGDVLWPGWSEARFIGLFEVRFRPDPGPTALVVYADSQAGIDPGWLDLLTANLPKAVTIICLTNDGRTLGCRIAKLSERLKDGNIVIVRAGARIRDPHWITQLQGYAALPGVGLAGARVVGKNGRIVAAGMVCPVGANGCEAAFAGLADHRVGSLYRAQVAHECHGVPAFCVALDHAFAGVLGLVPPQIDDPWALGLFLSEAIRSRGGHPTCVANCLAIAEPSLPIGAELGQAGPDPWYNPNLGRGRTQFEPTRFAHPPHRPQPVRLAVLSHNLDREGAQLMLLELLAGLKNARHCEPIVFSPRDGTLREDFERAGIGVVVIESPGRRADGKRLDDYVARLAQQFRKHGAEAVLANTLESFSGILAADCAGIAAVWWQHEGGPWHSYFGHVSGPTRALVHSAFALAYRVIQVADATRIAWRPIAVRDNFEVIRNGIAPELTMAMTRRWNRKTARASLRIADDDFCLLLVGSVSARKAQADMIAALKKVSSAAAERIRVFIVGRIVDATYGGRLKRRIDSLPAKLRGRTTLVGAIDDPALYYAAADLFVCCSRQESAPRAIMEAMEFGLPIVSTPVDGIPELVDFGQNGISYPAGNTRALAQAVEQLCTSLEMRLRLGRTSKVRISQNNDYQRMVGRFAELLSQAALLRNA